MPAAGNPLAREPLETPVVLKNLDEFQAFEEALAQNAEAMLELLEHYDLAHDGALCTPAALMLTLVQISGFAMLMAQSIADVVDFPIPEFRFIRPVKED